MGGGRVGARDLVGFGRGLGHLKIDTTDRGRVNLQQEGGGEEGEACAWGCVCMLLA